MSRAVTPERQPGVALAAFAVVALLGISIAHHAPARHVLLMLTGVALGGVLYQSVFGFTSAFRVLLANRRSAGLRAQMVMLGVACVLFFPVLAGSTLWGQPVIGFLSPVGMSLMFGAFSLHGWLWIVFALLGTWAGLHLLSVFGLSDVPPSKH